MKKKLFRICFLLFITAKIQSQTLAWAKQLGGASSDQGLSIAVDGSGNVYTTGTFSGTADFDPGIGTYTLTSFGSTDVFISKLDASGNLVWAKQFGSANSDVGRSIAVDASGNVLTAGTFSGTADFDPGIGTFTLATGGGIDIFISKLDATGNFVWAKSFNGPTTEQCNSLSLDISGNVYTTGFFDNSTDFDPGPSAFYLNPTGGNDVFISKLSANGNFVWAKVIGDISNEEGKSLDIDPFGNVVILGSFRGSNIDFDPGTGISYLSSSGFYDTFITKLDGNGNFIWAKVTAAGTGTATCAPASISTDLAGNIYTTGTFEMTADFDPSTGSFTLTSSGYKDFYINKIDANGNLVWVKGFGAPTTDDISYSLTSDASGAVYTIGNFGSTVDFDPGPSTFNLSATATDIFILKLVSAGNFGWVKQIGGPSSDYGTSINIDASGSLYSTGYFAGTVDFDPDPGIVNLTSSGSLDVFVQKLQPGALGTESLSFEPSIINIYPNPNNGSFSIDKIIENGDLIIRNSIGEAIFKKSILKGKTEIQLEQIAKGIYFIEITGKSSLYRSKFIIN